MKIKTIIRLLTVATLLLFVVPSCVKEGPPGLAGADGADGLDGADGDDGQVTCLVCHSGDNIQSKQAEFALSMHSIGEVREEREAWSSSCVQCHIPGGFVQYAETGDVIGTITNSERWECSTCHGLHQTFESTDYALRTTEPVDILGTSYDLGNNSNLCINCHKPRRGWENYDNLSHPDSVMITSEHAGPHHGPQGSLMLGIGGDHRIGSIDASSFGASPHGTNTEMATCVGCHMHASSDKSEGGHTYWPALEACQECHETESFDYKGKRTIIDGLLAELAELLEAQEGQAIERIGGVWQVVPGTVTGIVHEEDGAYHPVLGQFSREAYSAFWNFIFIVEDRSHGAHNPPYAEALLHNSIEALK